MPHIAPGTYRATAIRATLGESKTGKEFVAVDFELDDGAATQIQWRGFFTEKTADRTFESLRACGWKGDDLGDITFPDGNAVHLVIEDEEYEGKTHSRVQWVNAIRGPSVKGEMDANARKAFAAKMRGAIIAFDKKNPDAAPKGGDAPPF